MAIEEELKKAHQMFDNRNLITELKWSRRNFNQIRGAISKNSKLYYTWIFDQCIKALEQGSIIDWVPVNDRLPEEYVDVICCTNAKEVFAASYLGKLDDGSECFDDDNGMMYEGDVIAWMPLPEPYKDVDE
jgi:alkyl sulfatase BDS1-like metallo-beta-lactamase superfamily hydrolase